jgi:hypothetical protein
MRAGAAAAPIVVQHGMPLAPTSATLIATDEGIIRQCQFGGALAYTGWRTATRVKCDSSAIRFGIASRRRSARAPVGAVKYAGGDRPVRAGGHSAGWEGGRRWGVAGSLAQTTTAGQSIKSPLSSSEQSQLGPAKRKCAGRPPNTDNKDRRARLKRSPVRSPNCDTLDSLLRMSRILIGPLVFGACLRSQPLPAEHPRDAEQLLDGAVRD